MEQNIYGLSEGVFKACQFLGLQFPSEIPDEFKSTQKHMPSDYFGKNVTLNLEVAQKLLSELQYSKKQLAIAYKAFSDKYLSQKCFKHTTTDLNVYFCDYLLFVAKLGASIDDYFDFEFYNKSLEIQNKFMTQAHRHLTRNICNDPCAVVLLNDKSNTNKIFTDFLRRDWIYTCESSFEDFKAFVERHPRFFSKPFNEGFGKGAQIFNITPKVDLKNAFEILRNALRLLEEIVVQHKSLQEFCPDTVNTLRINTLLDMHNVVHILTVGGRFGRVGNVVDNFHGGGCSVIVDPKTGIVTSNSVNGVHERMSKHPDTGKTFKGFQYPSWDKVRAFVTTMAKKIPQIRHIGWDIAINYEGEPVLIEANSDPASDVQQASDDTGRRYLYMPLLDELWQYKNLQMKILGWRVNNLANFDYYYNTQVRSDSRLKLVMDKLIPDCASLIDLGCRKGKIVKSLCPEGIKYYPVDYKKHDSEVIACNFNEGEFPDIKADTCLCALTAEYVELLPQFLNNLCNAAHKQILMLCRPVDKECNLEYRWNYPFLTDFTEEFLLKTMMQNHFQLNAQYPLSDNQSVILYDFRK